MHADNYTMRQLEYSRVPAFGNTGTVRKIP